MLPPATTALLFSGGLDSAVLLAEEAGRGPVQPIYVHVGLAWEAEEHRAAERVVVSLARAERIRPLVSLRVDMTDVYAATHWAVQGRPPAYDTADEEVYLPGRNIVLLGKAAVYCAAAGIDRLVIGTLDHNPFPDATPEFRDAMASAVSIGMARPLSIDAPYARSEKADVVRRGAALGVPLAATLSCMNPSDGRHCGLCSKCRERHDAFRQAGIADPTAYTDRRHMTPAAGAN
jgi:7-cyano-7-deazaguanine synthase